ncbi:family 78 putative glycoside hydrolase [Triangularia verruculosa]|uniref:Family 78 putative glycoside hydrolase n=1 Tax=Triangularia verruculosa TaxID=2587418 RepID=A0AAN6XT51_9PEZI|nr:family 78 putative glycoside hydrolase [Triangularia verruculosa]
MYVFNMMGVMKGLTTLFVCFCLCLCLCLCDIGVCEATKGWSGPWEKYIRAPEDKRRIVPWGVWKTEGDVEVRKGKDGKKEVVTINEGGWVTWEFGENISGRVCIVVEGLVGGVRGVELGYSESYLFAGPTPDATTDRQARDLPLWLGVDHQGQEKEEVFCVRKEFVRGAFGYFTVHLPSGHDNKSQQGWFRSLWGFGQKLLLLLLTRGQKTKKTITISEVWVNCTSFPNQGSNGRAAYTGYFHSSSRLLNQIWYAGAYTLQLGTIDPREGGALIDYNRIVDNNTSPVGSWYSNFTISRGKSVVTDGAKRDRMVWPGDMFIAIPSIAVSTSDWDSIRNALEVLFGNQYADGRLPYAGPPMGVTERKEFSDTYHLHVLLGVYGYVVWSGEVEWLRGEIWGRYLFALRHSIGIVDGMDLVHVTSTADWLRPGMTGHNLEATALLHAVLSRSEVLAGWLGYDVPAIWGEVRERLETGLARLYCPEYGLFSDNIGARSCYPGPDQEYRPVLPQDGNSWVLISQADLTPSGLPFRSPKSRFRSPVPLPHPPAKEKISNALRQRWVKHGAPCPEFPNTISPFASGFEVLGHAISGEVDTAVELMLLEWGHLINGDGFNGGSTLAEGFRIDGDIQYPAYPSRARNSLAHGWASGPTWVLTEWVLGIKVTEPGGRKWEVKGDMSKWLGWVRGGVTFGNGERVEVKAWRVKCKETTGVVWEVKAEGVTKGMVMGVGLEGERVVVLVKEGEKGERVASEGARGKGEGEGWYRDLVVDYGGEEWVFDDEWREPVMEEREAGVVDWSVMEENFMTEVWEGWKDHIGFTEV